MNTSIVPNAYYVFQIDEFKLLEAYVDLLHK